MKRSYCFSVCVCLAALASAALPCNAWEPDTEDAPAKEATGRPQWDQDEAVARVKKVLEIEKSGDLPWDDIAWETDPEQAAARSEKENKPLFVYMFLKKNIGPLAAPC